MKRIFTLNISDLPFLITLVTILFSSCSTRVEKEAMDQAGLETTKIVKEIPVITVATLDAVATDEGYFDLIVETSGCLGENLWIGGKLESKTGGTTGENEFDVTQFTATGLNSNVSYALENQAGTIKAVSNEAGVLQLQLQEGLLKLRPVTSSGPILIAYHKNESDKPEYQPGYWSCK